MLIFQLRKCLFNALLLYIVVFEKLNIERALVSVTLSFVKTNLNISVIMVN